MTVVLAATLEWVTLNVTVDFPAATVTLAGTEAAAVFELFRLRTTLAAVGPDKVTVPVTAVVELPFTEVGETETDASTGAWIESDAFCELEP